MEKDEAIKLLIQELDFESRTAMAYVRAGGCCEYCGRELVFDRLAYACAEIDHLLPRAKYSEHITGKPENFVLSCSLCNGAKRDTSVLLEGENPELMLAEARTELINRAKKGIEIKLQKPNEMWKVVKTTFAALILSA